MPSEVVAAVVAVEAAADVVAPGLAAVADLAGAALIRAVDMVVAAGPVVASIPDQAKCQAVRVAVAAAIVQDLRRAPGRMLAAEAQ